MSEQDIEKVQRYFEAALSVPAHKRAEFLTKLSNMGAGLREEVEARLVDATRHNASDSGEHTKTVVLMPQRYRAGDKIGPHRIVGKIGNGGMGVIYKALDTRLNRHVALKFLPASMHSDTNIRKRFFAEARAASQLDHPNICVIHDIGKTQDGLIRYL